jgi:hypothetical protein
MLSDMDIAEVNRFAGHGRPRRKGSSETGGAVFPQATNSSSSSLEGGLNGGVGSSLPAPPLSLPPASFASRRGKGRCDEPE